jgi:hypothetical protein
MKHGKTRMKIAVHFRVFSLFNQWLSSRTSPAVSWDGERLQIIGLQ